MIEGRNYRLSIVNPQGQEIVIQPPFTLHFTITRNTLATTNTAELELKNLGPTVRNMVFKDRFDTSIDWTIVLYAGYGRNLYLVLKGNIHEAFSYKQGTDWTTKILCFDGVTAFQNSFVAQSFGANSEKKDIITSVVSTLKGISLGLLGAFSVGTNLRGKVVFGYSRDVLMSETQGNFFIDNSILHVMADEEIDGSEVLELDPSTNLGTPQRRDSSVDVTILFFPQARVGVGAKLTSLFPIYNGVYKIMGIRHDVLISESENGKAETTLNLLITGGAFKAINP